MPQEIVSEHELERQPDMTTDYALQGSAGGWLLETGRITLKVAPSEKEGWLDSHSSEVVPCTDRPVTIDRTPKTQ